MEYLIIIENGENNLSAYSPDVLGCVATGQTVEETLQNMKDALSFHLEDLFYQSEPIPQPQGIEKHLAEINIHTDDLFTFLTIDFNSIMAKAA